MQRIEEFSTSYDERENQSLDELANETRCLVTIAFNNIEYLLGNADFEEAEIQFERVEMLHGALGEMSEELNEEKYEELRRVSKE